MSAQLKSMWRKKKKIYTAVCTQMFMYQETPGLLGLDEAALLRSFRLNFCSDPTPGRRSADQVGDLPVSEVD